MKNVILDLDTGIDDTLALLYVLAKKDEINLLGVTSVFGNVETLQSARNSHENTQGSCLLLRRRMNCVKSCIISDKVV